MLAALTRGLVPVAPRAMAPAAALGCVLAEALRAPCPVPAWAVALRAGWAVVAAETLGAGPFSPLPLATPPRRVAAGEALPEGADAVLDPFGLEGEAPFAMAVQEAAPGDGLRGAGEEIAAGATIRAAGERLRAPDLPALAAIPVTAVRVRVPRVAVEHADTAIAALLGAWVRATGGELVAAAPDLLLTDQSGLAEAVTGLGARPGMAAGIGRRDGVPAVLLPALAEEAVAAWLLLGLPALRILAGAATPGLRLRLARKVASTVGLAELVPLAVDTEGLAVPLATGALPLAALAGARAVLVVPPGAEGYEAGSVIEALPLD
jgi:molybdopterin molybdotransferase